jgi:hypothetical protein
MEEAEEDGRGHRGWKGHRRRKGTNEAKRRGSVNESERAGRKCKKGEGDGRRLGKLKTAKEMEEGGKTKGMEDDGKRRQRGGKAATRKEKD